MHRSWNQIQLRSSLPITSMNQHPSLFIHLAKWTQKPGTNSMAQPNRSTSFQKYRGIWMMMMFLTRLQAKILFGDVHIYKPRSSRPSSAGETLHNVIFYWLRLRITLRAVLAARAESSYPRSRETIRAMLLQEAHLSITAQNSSFREKEAI